MLDLLSPEFRPFIGVGGLTLLFLLVASLVNRYRAWLADRYHRCQKMLRSADRLYRSREQLARRALPREVREFARSELIARYREVKALLPQLDGIAERIGDLERGSGSNELNGDWTAPEIDGESDIKTYTAGLTGLVDYLGRERLSSRLGPGAARQLRDRLRVLRAEAQFNYYQRSARESATSGLWDQALTEVLKLLAFLKAKAPRNEYGLGLYYQVLDQYRDLSRRQLPAGWAPSDTDGAGQAERAGTA